MSNDVIDINRTISVSAERTFEAWTRPELLRQWWCTPGCRFERIDMDLRPEGAYFFDVVTTDGAPACTVEGHFQEVSRPGKLVYSWTMRGPGFEEADTTVTVRFHERDGRTELYLQHAGFKNEEIYKLHAMDWPIVLDNLAGLLSQPQTESMPT